MTFLRNAAFTLVLLAPTLAFARGEGSIICQHEAMSLEQALKDRGGQISESDRHSVETSLEVAKSQCLSSTTQGEQTISQAWQVLNAASHQSSVGTAGGN